MKLNVAVLFFLGYSASADNLRANSPPRRYLASNPSSSSSTSSATEYTISCALDCDMDEAELQKAVQNGLDELNSSSSSSSSDTSLEDGAGARRLSSSKDEKFIRISGSDCSANKIKKAIESLDSSSSSSKSRRGRVRRLSGSSDDDTIDMTCIRAGDWREACNSDASDEDLARKVLSENTRRLKGADAKVTILEVEDVTAEERSRICS